MLEMQIKGGMSGGVGGGLFLFMFVKLPCHTEWRKAFQCGKRSSLFYFNKGSLPRDQSEQAKQELAKSNPGQNHTRNNEHQGLRRGTAIKEDLAQEGRER